LGTRKRRERDYNKLVANLNEDALREALANYLAKLKKTAEMERRQLRRELRKREIEEKLKQKQQTNYSPQAQ
jgi:cytochrome c553